MDVKEYIESGIIEAYATGMLVDTDAKEVEQMGSKYPEVQAAILQAQSTLASLTKAYAVQPKPEWKDDILNAAFAAKGDSTANIKDPVVRSLKDESSSRKSSTSVWAIAASIALIVSLGINAFQYATLNDFRAELTATNLRLAELEESNQVLVANYKEANQNLAVLTDPGTASFVMKGVEGRNPEFRADVFWNSTTEMVYLNVKNLPHAPNGKQYQLWALLDGKPIDMGVFDGVDPEKTLKAMGSVPGAQAFAVTLEPKGGSVNPTLEEMYVYGALAT
ncbi:MAG: anti-sigma factor [Owenweeksia sp.]